MQKLFTVLAAVFFVVIGVFSCVKPATPAAPAKYTGCRISQITQIGVDSGSRATSTFYYNDDGTVKRIYTAQPQYYSGSNKYFEYKGNFIVIRTVPLGGSDPSATDSLTLDAEGRTTYISHSNGSYGYYYATSLWERYRYDSAGNMIQHTSQDYSTQTTDTFQWKNGDMIKKTDDNTSGSVEVYTYTYSDTVYNTGNINARISDFLSYGRPIYTPKHLVTSETCFTCYSVTFNYAYGLDSAGKLTYFKEIPMDGANANLKTSWVTYACE